MLTALRQSASMFSRYYLNEDFNDMHFDFELRDDIKIGEPFSVVLVMKNRSRTADHFVTVTLRVDTVNYMGRIKEDVRKDTTDRLVKAGAGKKYTKFLMQYFIL
jgi:transglutaminase 1